jgi:hypothetical protein
MADLPTSPTAQGLGKERRRMRRGKEGGSSECSEVTFAESMDQHLEGSRIAW